MWYVQKQYYNRVNDINETNDINQESNNTPILLSKNNTPIFIQWLKM